MNYSLIKKAMASVGHVVTKGEAWAASDAAAFRDFAHFTLGIPHDAAHGILMFHEHFEAAWNKIKGLAGHQEVLPEVAPVPAAASVEATTVESTPVAPVVAPVVPVAPVVEPVAPVVEEVAAPVTEAPEASASESAKETDTPPVVAQTMNVSGPEA